MKSRGALIVVVLLLAAGGFWWWKRRGSGDTPATSTVTQSSGKGSSVTSGASNANASGARDEGFASVVITVSGDKGPIAGATVRLAPEEGDVIVLETDKAGVAKADKLAVGTWEIAASAAGFEPGNLRPRELAKNEVANLALTLVAGGATLSGTVTDATGGPIAGARVDAAKIGGGDRLGKPSDAVATTMTGSDGKYQMSVSAGQSVVAVSSPDYSPQSRHVEIVAPSTTADFSLVPGGVIEGVVRDARTKEIVAGAKVVARRDGGGGVAFAEAGRYRAMSGADGRFRLAGLRPGAYDLEARQAKRVTTEPVIVGIGVAEQVTDVELLVGTGLVLSGIVVDESDKPVPNVSVSLNGDGPGLAEDSDDKGAFAFVGLPPGRYFLIPVAEDWQPDGFTPLELQNKDLVDVKVRVRRAIKVTGHVEPRQPCTISHEAEAAFGTGELPMMIAPRPTEPNGDFTIPTGKAKAKLTARCPSGAYGTKSIDAKSADAPIVIEVKGGASIAGRVVDGKGQPVANATVMAAPDGDERRVTVVNGMVTSGVQALSNAQGEYVILGLEPGPYRMSALDGGRPLRARGKPPRVELTDAEKKTGVDIPVDRPDGVIRGVVTGPDGKPLADAWVSVHQDLEAMLEGMRDRDDKHGSQSMTVTTSSDDDASSDFAPALTDANGKFEISRLPHAKYEVIAEAQAGALRGRASGVSPDATLAIQALGLTSLGGTVRGANGPSAVFHVEVIGPTSAARTFTDGKFQFGRVDPGAYELRFTSPDGNATKKVTVAANQPTTVDVSLVANATVIGKVVDTEGNPAKGVGVVLIKDEGTGRTSVSLSGPPPMTGEDGSFRVEGPAQLSSLVLMQPPSPTVKAGLALEPGKTLDLGVIRLEPRAGSGAKPPP